MAKDKGYDLKEIQGVIRAHKDNPAELPHEVFIALITIEQKALVKAEITGLKKFFSPKDPKDEGPLKGYIAAVIEKSDNPGLREALIGCKAALGFNNAQKYIEEIYANKPKAAPSPSPIPDPSPEPRKPLGRSESTGDLRRSASESFLPTIEDATSIQIESKSYLDRVTNAYNEYSKFVVTKAVRDLFWGKQQVEPLDDVLADYKVGVVLPSEWLTNISQYADQAEGRKNLSALLKAYNKHPEFQEELDIRNPIIVMREIYKQMDFSARGKAINQVHAKAQQELDGFDVYEKFHKEDLQDKTKKVVDEDVVRQFAEMLGAMIAKPGITTDLKADYFNVLAAELSNPECQKAFGLLLQVYKSSAQLKEADLKSIENKLSIRDWEALDIIAEIQIAYKDAQPNSDLHNIHNIAQQRFNAINFNNVIPNRIDVINSILDNYSIADGTQLPIGLFAALAPRCSEERVAECLAKWVAVYNKLPENKEYIGRMNAVIEGLDKDQIKALDKVLVGAEFRDRVSLPGTLPSNKAPDVLYLESINEALSTYDGYRILGDAVKALEQLTELLAHYPDSKPELPLRLFTALSKRCVDSVEDRKCLGLLLATCSKNQDIPQEALDVILNNIDFYKNSGRALTIMAEIYKAYKTSPEGSLNALYEHANKSLLAIDYRDVREVDMPTITEILANWPISADDKPVGQLPIAMFKELVKNCDKQAYKDCLAKWLELYNSAERTPEDLKIINDVISNLESGKLDIFYGLMEADKFSALSLDLFEAMNKEFPTWIAHKHSDYTLLHILAAQAKYDELIRAVKRKDLPAEVLNAKDPNHATVFDYLCEKGAEAKEALKVVLNSDHFKAESLKPGMFLNVDNDIALTIFDHDKFVGHRKETIDGLLEAAISGNKEALQTAEHILSNSTKYAKTPQDEEVIKEYYGRYNAYLMELSKSMNGGKRDLTEQEKDIIGAYQRVIGIMISKVGGPNFAMDFKGLGEPTFINVLCMSGEKEILEKMLTNPKVDIVTAGKKKGGKANLTSPLASAYDSAVQFVIDDKGIEVPIIKVRNLECIKLLLAKSKERSESKEKDKNVVVVNTWCANNQLLSHNMYRDYRKSLEAANAILEDVRKGQDPAIIEKRTAEANAILADAQKTQSQVAKAEKIATANAILEDVRKGQDPEIIASKIAAADACKANAAQIKDVLESVMMAPGFNANTVCTFKLEKKDNKSVQKVDGNTLFMQACLNGDEEFAYKLFITKKTNDVDLRIKNSFNQTALTLAVVSGNVNLIGALLTSENMQDVNINAVDYAIEYHGKKRVKVENNNILLYAYATGNQDIVDMVIGAGAKENKKIKSGRNILMAAISGGNMDMIKNVMETRPELIKKRNKNGESAIHFAAASEQSTENLKLVVEHGANVNAKNKQGVTPLMIAVSNDDIEAVKFLLSKGADINARDKEGNTPLHIACDAGSIAMVELLCKDYRIEHLRNKAGFTPYMLANLQTNIEACRVQKEEEELKAQVTKERQLHGEQQQENIEVKVEAKDKDKWKGDAKIAEILLRAGAEPYTTKYDKSLFSSLLPNVGLIAAGHAAIGFGLSFNPGLQQAASGALSAVGAKSIGTNVGHKVGDLIQYYLNANTERDESIDFNGRLLVGNYNVNWWGGVTWGAEFKTLIAGANLKYKNVDTAIVGVQENYVEDGEVKVKVEIALPDYAKKDLQWDVHTELCHKYIQLKKRLDTKYMLPWTRISLNKVLQEIVSVDKDSRALGDIRYAKSLKGAEDTFGVKCPVIYYGLMQSHEKLARFIVKNPAHAESVLKVVDDIIYDRIMTDPELKYQALKFRDEFDNKLKAKYEHPSVWTKLKGKLQKQIHAETVEGVTRLYIGKRTDEAVKEFRNATVYAEKQGIAMKEIEADKPVLTESQQVANEAYRVAKIFAVACDKLGVDTAEAVRRVSRAGAVGADAAATAAAFVLQERKLTMQVGTAAITAGSAIYASGAIGAAYVAGSAAAAAAAPVVLAAGAITAAGFGLWQAGKKLYDIYKQPAALGKLEATAVTVDFNAAEAAIDASARRGEQFLGKDIEPPKASEVAKQNQIQRPHSLVGSVLVLS